MRFFDSYVLNIFCLMLSTMTSFLLCRLDFVRLMYLGYILSYIFFHDEFLFIGVRFFFIQVNWIYFVLCLSSWWVSYYMSQIFLTSESKYILFYVSCCNWFLITRVEFSRLTYFDTFCPVSLIVINLFIFFNVIFVH